MRGRCTFSNITWSSDLCSKEAMNTRLVVVAQGSDIIGPGTDEWTSSRHGARTDPTRTASARHTTAFFASSDSPSKASAAAAVGGRQPSTLISSFTTGTNISPRDPSTHF